MEKLITHNDLDSMSYSILTRLVFINDVDIVYVNVTESVDKKINELHELNKHNQYKRIYVTDFSCDECFFWYECCNIK